MILLQPTTKMANSYSIPVIDLQDFPANLTKLIKASEEWGCFRVVNFDNILPVSLMYDMKVVVASLLDRPLDVKLRNVDVTAGSGYKVPGRMNPIHEGLGFYDAASSEAVDTFCTQLDATPQQREIITKYTRGLNELVKDLGRKLGEGLGLADVPFGSWPCQFRMNKYPFVPENVGSDGLKTHTEYGFLTVVQDDEQIGGLEVMRKSGEFVAVEPYPGTFVVNFGDLATAWSNGKFYNVKHRVVCKQAGTRISMATFLLGPTEEVVEPPPQLVTPQNPRLYIPFVFEDLKNARFSNLMNAGEALDVFRVEF